jgi:protein-L-isoaspartate(D-aspartate) O-methyltransferase
MNAKPFSGIGMTSQRTRQRLVNRLIDSGIKNLEVLDAIRETPRHLFVDEALATRAYEDTALPIGFQQTLSQPYIVARMTELLIQEGKPNKVLEIGTGSGYQTAILAQLIKYVYSTERISQLQSKAKERLRDLGFKNIRFQHSDGNYGWAREAPFDAIISTAAPETVPQNLLDQLAIGGRLVIPVGSESQELQLIVRNAEQDFETQVIEDVLFVPLKKGVV